MAPEPILKLIWWIAVLTMTIGNVLALLQQNVKRILAYSSVAHSGYMLAGLAAALYARGDGSVVHVAIDSVLFYLAAYGLMNLGTFAVLTILPAREKDGQPGMAAETLDDLAGAGRRHLPLGLVMVICCFSLTGIPLTVGFLGKLYLIRPALQTHLNGLAVIILVNAAISSGYYLKIIAAMFLRVEPGHAPNPAHPHLQLQPAEASAPHIPHDLTRANVPIVVCAGLSAFTTLLFGTLLPATQVMVNKTSISSTIEDPIVLPQVVESPNHDGPAVLAADAAQ